MNVKALRAKPTADDLAILGEEYTKFRLGDDSHISVGSRYLVLEMFLNVDPGQMGFGAWFTLECDHGHLESYPACLFAVVDDSLDPEWTVSIDREAVVIGPALLRQDHFREDFHEEVPTVTREFRAFLRRMGSRTSRQP